MIETFAFALLAAAWPGGGSHGVPAQPRAPAIQLVADGCGRGFHRDGDDECRPNPGPGGYFGGAHLLGYQCPPGFHFGRTSGMCRSDRDD